jgi:Mg2+ and Co2+ transporter CorA
MPPDGIVSSLQALVKILAERARPWVDPDTPRTEDAAAVLREVFDLHPLLIEDMLHEAHISKSTTTGTTCNGAARHQLRATWANSIPTKST